MLDIKHAVLLAAYPFAFCTSLRAIKNGGHWIARLLAQGSRPICLAKPIMRNMLHYTHWTYVLRVSCIDKVQRPTSHAISLNQSLELNSKSFSQYTQITNTNFHVISGFQNAVFWMEKLEIQKNKETYWNLFNHPYRPAWLKDISRPWKTHLQDVGKDQAQLGACRHGRGHVAKCSLIGQQHGRSAL